MKFKTPDWWQEKPNVFLGTVQNPHSRKFYDLYLISTHGDGSQFSITARHGDEDYQYEEFPLYESMIRYDGTKATKDFVWGMNQALIAGLWYLAFNSTPLRHQNG